MQHSTHIVVQRIAQCRVVHRGGEPIPPLCDRPCVRTQVTAGASGRSTVPPPAPACAEWPLRGVLPARWPPTRPGKRCVASAGASPPPRTSSPAPGCADVSQPGCLSTALPPAPACADRPQPGRPARLRSSLPPWRAQSVHCRGVQPVKCPPSRPSVRESATTGAGCLSRIPLPPRRANTGCSRGVRPVKCPPSLPGVRKPAATGASPPPGSSSPAPCCADLPQPGRIACLVSSLPPRPAQSRHGRGVLPKRCPRSHPGVRCVATAGVYCLTSVLPPAPACARQPQPGCTAC